MGRGSREAGVSVEYLKLNFQVMQYVELTYYFLWIRCSDLLCSFLMSLLQTSVNLNILLIIYQVTLKYNVVEFGHSLLVVATQKFCSVILMCSELYVRITLYKL